MPRRLLKIAMVISSLSAGGAERVVVLLARGLTALGHRVSIVTIFGADRDFYATPEGVDRVALDLGGETRSVVEKVTANARRLAALRRAVRRLGPDVVISFMPETNVLALLAGWGTRVPVVVTEHADPRVFRLKPPWETLRRVTYRRAARVVSVSAGVDEHFAWLPGAKRAVIPNPIPLGEIRSEKPGTGPICEKHPAGGAGESDLPSFSRWPHVVMGMGRLAPEKGFDVLIGAFARSAAELPDWGLVILGEGSERATLESIVAELGLQDRVCLPGVVDDPFSALRRADVFVLSSRSESFGNALVEAMACGLPVVATKCWSRSPGLVRDGVDGVLVPADDVDALAGAMSELMRDEARRRQFASEAAGAVERFDVAAVSQTWDELLQAIAGRRSQ
ncbi:MAG TPA: glycosyltransferase family 4 protein [Thermoguttaceae bacterium]|nr:glycosyltransferase family 4 protein [Thermoguttaceae bacterium]